MSCNYCKILKDEINFLTTKINKLEEELRQSQVKESSMRSVVKLYQLGSIPTSISNAPPDDK